ncbi:transglycosylase domain-containing protein [Spelaeicoccus albus]
MAQQSTMVAKDGSVIAKFYWENRIEVPLKKIAPSLRHATVDIEDYRFFKHGGVDINGILRAAVHNVLSPSTQGASTLTQQYVKNVLVEDAHAKDDAAQVEAATDDSGFTGIARKMREAKLAVAVEKKYSKKEILNRYLNINNYGGNPRQYGVEAASRHYWGIHASELNIAQSALLAGIVQNPSAYNPERHPKAALTRRNTVLGEMLKRDHITRKQHDKAVKKGLGLEIHRTSNGCVGAGTSAFFCAYVEKIIESNKAFGKTATERHNLLTRGGLTIKTTIDPRLQKIAQRTVSGAVPNKDKSGVGHSLVTVRPGNGHIVAMVENRTYSVSPDAGRSETSINYNVDRTRGGAGGFQVGSTWKAYVLAQWLKSGNQLYDRVDASRNSYYGFKTSCAKRNYATHGYTLKNANDSEGLDGPMSVLEGTKHSVNTAFAAMASTLDMCKIRDTAMSLGVHDGSGKPLNKVYVNNVKSQRVLLPSSILGTMSISPLTMASSYATFADRGVYCQPKAITSITDGNGTKLKLPHKSCHRSLKKGIADGVAYALTQTFEGGTTDDLKIPYPAGAKTGTTNFEVGVGWLVGFTKGLSTAVWTGDPTGNNYELGAGHVKIDGKYVGPMYGATISGPTWQKFMTKAGGMYRHAKFGPAPPKVLGHRYVPPAPPPVDDSSPETSESPSTSPEQPSSPDPSSPPPSSSDPTSNPPTSDKPSSPPAESKKPAPPSSNDGGKDIGGKGSNPGKTSGGKDD